MTLEEQAAALASGAVSSVELTEAAIERAEAWQPRINAFIRIEAEQALTSARASDARRAAGGARGPLDGVPMAHKDMFDRTGELATGGSLILRDRRATEDSTIATRLEAAGAVWLGGLNMAEFAANPVGLNPHYGHCRNPWNPDYIAGGSSSGSGAAVAAGIVAAALGSDTGGSIRLPASICGVVGLKPTYGRVSLHGALPRAFSLDTVGPLATTAADCALLLAAIAGHDPNDGNTIEQPVPTFSEMTADARGMTVAVLTGLDGIAPALQARHEAALVALETSGVKLVERRMDWITSLYGLADTISKCEAATMHGRWMKERPQDYSRFVFSRTEAGFHILATRYIEALALRGRMLSRFVTEILADADALFLPTTPVTVPTIAEVDTDEGAAIATIIGELARLTRPFSYLGVPAISVPCGPDDHGLPTGFQLAARPFAEATLLRLARHYQAATDWPRTAR
jgi:aspartyl-tRNA(Asn)/glutamyl-tRNA(Gln) amidotransferase subunit A